MWSRGDSKFLHPEHLEVVELKRELLEGTDWHL
jgi:hypothetical protein